uniref:Uncharacterized protein n=1 Tax=Caenorhabditis japonica TaxID=281687 RepID=A0A8R1HQF5_CAEJA
MADQNRPLTVEERRARRLAKILGNPEGRINRILSNGEDENGARHAPAIEGGEGYNILPNPLNSGEIIAPTVDPLLDFPGLPAEFAQFAGAGAGAGQMPQNLQTPPVKGINVTLVAIVLGLLSRGIMIATGPINIGVLWAIFYGTLVAKFSAAGMNNQTRNELAAMFQAMGNGNAFEKIMNIGFMIVEFVQSTVTFAASFLLAHLLLELYDFPADYQIVF